MGATVLTQLVVFGAFMRLFDGANAGVVDGAVEQLAGLADARHLVADALGEVQTLLTVGAALARRRLAPVDELRPRGRESIADERDLGH